MQQGTKIGRFTLQNRIGSGATSVVYRAIEAESERVVAFKLLARALAFNAYARAQLQREIERLVTLQHPQIVPILQTGMYREQVYLISPFYAAGSLEAQMNGNWTLAAARVLVSQLAAPLDMAHAAGLVHGRLKSSNILFDDNAMPLICDFGLTQLELANSGSWRGNALNVTPYTAPEQLMGMSLDGRTDVYALGKLVRQLTQREDVAQAAVRENSAERPPTIANLAETLVDQPKVSWGQRIAQRVANLRRSAID